MKRVALGLLGGASLAMLVGFASDSEQGAILTLLLTAVFPVSLIVVGASRGDRIGPLGLPVLVVAILLEGSLIAMLLLRGRVLDGPWIGGLPLAAALQIYAMWVACFVVVVVAYAVTFETFTLTEGDLDRLDQMSNSEE